MFIYIMEYTTLSESREPLLNKKKSMTYNFCKYIYNLFSNRPNNHYSDIN
jgi:hypothetical protein